MHFLTPLANETSGDQAKTKFKEIKPCVSPQAIAREKFLFHEQKALHAKVCHRVKEGMIFKAHERSARVLQTVACKAE